SGADGADCFGIALLDSAEPKTAQAVTTAADSGVLVIAAKLGNRSHDDGVHTQNPPDLGGCGWIGAVAIGKILFGKNLVQLFPLDHAILAVLHELLHKKVGNALAYVLVSAPDGSNVRTHRAIVKIQYSHALLLRLLGRAGGNQQTHGAH